MPFFLLFFCPKLLMFLTGVKFTDNLSLSCSSLLSFESRGAWFGVSFKTLPMMSSSSSSLISCDDCCRREDDGLFAIFPSGGVGAVTTPKAGEWF